MPTTYYNYPDFAYSQNGLNQSLDAFAEAVDGDLHTLSTTLSGNYYEQSEVDALDATLSGVLSNEIDSDISTHEGGASHDGRYYTEAEVDALHATHSGGSDHDGRYYQESEVDTTLLDYVKMDGTQIFTDGATGWFDDGEFFRITVSGGAITNIATTSSGGYSMS